MITGPLVPDLVVDPDLAQARPTAAKRAIGPGSPRGIVLIALGILGAVAWGIFLSPFGLHPLPARRPLPHVHAHQAGTYVVYLEFPGESRAAAAARRRPRGGRRCRGSEVELHPIGHPGRRRGARRLPRVAATRVGPWPMVTAAQAGTFLLTVTPKPAGQFDPTSTPVTEGTIAIGRGFGPGWPTTQWCGLALSAGPGRPPASALSGDGQAPRVAPVACAGHGRSAGHYRAALGAPRRSRGRRRRRQPAVARGDHPARPGRGPGGRDRGRTARSSCTSG